MMDTQSNERLSQETIKFGILVGICVLVIFTLWISRPLVFGRIAPAVFGSSVLPQPTVDVNVVPTTGEVAPELTGNNETTDAPAPAVVPTESTEIITLETNATPQAPPMSPPQEVVHTVQAGDTLYGISEQYGVSPEALIQANVLYNPHQLQIGDQITIPQ